MSAFYPKEKDNWLKHFCDISIFLKKPFKPIDAIDKIEKTLKSKSF